MKKIILILIIAAAGVLLYMLFGKKAADTTTAAPTDGNFTPTPADKSTITIVSANDEIKAANRAKWQQLFNAAKKKVIDWETTHPDWSYNIMYRVLDTKFKEDMNASAAELAKYQ